MISFFLVFISILQIVCIFDVCFSEVYLMFIDNPFICIIWHYVKVAILSLVTLFSAMFFILICGGVL